MVKAGIGPKSESDSTVCVCGTEAVVVVLT